MLLCSSKLESSDARRTGQCAPVIAPCLSRGIRIVSNAGGLDPRGLTQAITDLARQCFMETFAIGPRELGMRLIYDVCHNVAKFETHVDADVLAAAPMLREAAE